MKSITLVFAIVFSICQAARPQAMVEEVRSTNRAIDHAVVKRDLTSLRTLYADDFIFTHGTGRVDDKEGWLKSVGNPDSRFESREHDSVTVELHDDIALVSGRLIIVRYDKSDRVQYGIWYNRVFRRRDGKWQLISHRTTREWHF